MKLNFIKQQGSPNGVIDKIIDINKRCADFWLKSQGWAPKEAAELLSKSRLDWQVSLSETLRLWCDETNENLTDGQLILAWANLGALVEGTLKLLLSIYYKDYMEDTETVKSSNAYDNKKLCPKSPDELTLQNLKIFSKKNSFFKDDTYDFIDLVQERRNAIHAYKSREIGTYPEFKNAVSRYYKFVKDVESRFPYPPW